MMFKACCTTLLYYNKCDHLSHFPLVNLDSTLVKRLSFNGVNTELLSKRFREQQGMFKFAHHCFAKVVLSRLGSCMKGVNIFHNDT